MATATTDMYESFDKIDRVSAYALLARGGFPLGPPVAYMSHMEGLEVVGAYSQGCGKPTKRPCSIPQGC
eukprot:14283400-Alexandrium_andersonii.AAC.1